MQKQPVRVTILGQTYTVMAPGDPREVQQLAREVDELMASIAARSPSADPARVAVLASLHLADKLQAIERELVSLKARIDSKSEQFSLLLDRAIEPEP